MKVKRDVPMTSAGIRKRTEWGRCIVLKGTSESETNESEERDKKPRHSRKEPNENVGKEDNARECNVSEDKSRDLEAHAGCTG
jgi:hypothetical protein